MTYQSKRHRQLQKIFFYNEKVNDFLRKLKKSRLFQYDCEIRKKLQLISQRLFKRALNYFRIFEKTFIKHTKKIS